MIFPKPKNRGKMADYCFEKKAKKRNLKLQRIIPGFLEIEQPIIGIPLKCATQR
jgi:hypothetical protein